MVILPSKGQNLIKNGSFEEVECPDNTIASFFESEYWNATGADAYWIHSSCSIDPDDTQSIVAINTEIIPYAGSGYISLESIIFKNGYCISEGISQKLSTPISKGSYYYFELATLKFGLENPLEEIPAQCSIFPDRGLELRLDNQHITFDLDSKSVNTQPMVCDIKTSSQLILNDIHIRDASSTGIFWNAYWTCFEAQEDFSHLAITGANKLFAELNDCMETGLPGLQHITGYAVDNIQLYEIPQELQTTLTICEGSAFFSIDEWLEGPFVDKATLAWEDGVKGGNRTFQKAGNYVLLFDLPCISVPISVEVVDENCTVEVFVPNVFSIRENSPNNTVKPYLKSNFPIEAYNWIIFDRWGNLIFSTNQLEEVWDGRDENKFVEEGVYMWKMEFTINNGSVRRELIGSITLLK